MYSRCLTIIVWFRSVSCQFLTCFDLKRINVYNVNDLYKSIRLGTKIYNIILLNTFLKVNDMFASLNLKRYMKI